MQISPFHSPSIFGEMESEGTAEICEQMIKKMALNISDFTDPMLQEQDHYHALK